MLQVQVQYWTLQETKRHNIETENLGWSTLEETKRHNLSTEELGWSTLGETKRHNLATEGVAQGQLDVSRGQLNLGYDSLAEQKRHALETEAQGRENLQIGWRNAASNAAQASAALQQADVARQNAQTKYGEYLFSQTKWNEQREIEQQQADAATKNAEANMWNALNRVEQTNISQEQASSAQQNADTNWYNAQTGRLQFWEGTAKDTSSELREWMAYGSYRGRYGY